MARLSIGNPEIEDELPRLPVKRSQVRALEVAGLSVVRGGRVILQDVGFDVESREIVAIIGASGCGKTTFLHCVAGFVPLESGLMHLDGNVVAGAGRDIAPERRQIGMVFQGFALWPHLSVRDNVAYPWKVRGIAKQDRHRRADDLLARVGLKNFGERRPASLSGGQQQRVALARALAGEPRLLLLDEPFSSVDAVIKDELIDLVTSLVSDFGVAGVIATHDPQDALRLADRIVVLDQGRVAQAGKVADLARCPATEFVARFVGSGEVLTARCLTSSVIEVGGMPMTVDYLEQAVEATLPSCQIKVVVAAEDVVIGAVEDGCAGRVVHLRRTAGGIEYRLLVGEEALRCYESGPARWQSGDLVGVRLLRAFILREASSLQ